MAKAKPEVRSIAVLAEGGDQFSMFEVGEFSADGVWLSGPFLLEQGESITLLLSLAGAGGKKDELQLTVSGLVSESRPNDGRLLVTFDEPAAVAKHFG